jgi:hypothetical protein
MSSDTSSELNVNYLDKNGNKLSTKTEMKRQTSDTDYHFSMIANQEKVIEIKSESSSDLDNIVNSSESKKSSSSSSSSSRRSSSSRPRIDRINMSDTRPEMHMPSNTNNIPNLEPTFIPIKELSPQEIRMKKIELLRRLSEIKAKGYSLTKDYDFNSSIEEMEYEYGLLKSFADKRNGVKLYKNILLNGISLIEFANEKYDPFDFKLSGWSDHMSVEVDSYDDVIEELYEKYKGTGKGMPPEIKLIFLVLASGAAFHFSKTALGNIGVSSMANGVMGKMMAGDKKESQFKSPQEMNLEKQKQMFRERERQQKINLQQQQKPQPMFQNHTQAPVNMGPPSIPQFNGPSMTRDGPEIRAPSNVQDILNRIKHIQQKNEVNINTTETQDESTVNDRLVSDSTFSESKRRGRKPRKPVISINTN